MRYAKIGAGVIAALLIVTATALFGTGMLSLQRGAGGNTGAIIANAAKYHVLIKRDSWGVPHIEGKRDADVAFGIAYAHSEDDFKTIQDVALAVRGDLAATEGVSAATGDYLVRLMRVWPRVNAHYAQLPADLRVVLEAYADGVNYYAALHPKEVKPGLLPMTGRDVAAGFVFKTPFFYGFDATLKRLTQSTGGKEPSEIGSNGAVIAPSRAPDGATRLLVNSHQPYDGPVAWYEAVLQSGEGWHVAGGFFPGSPFMLHGFNEHLGWANTVNNADFVDIYRLKVNPANDNQYWFEGAWRDLRVEDAALRVKIFGPLVWTVHKPVYFAAQGPVMKTDHGVYAIRFAGIEEWRQPLQYFRLDKANNIAEWRAAMALNALPSINYLYADAAGNIGYVFNGQFPARKDGVDWTTYLPGDRADLIWHSYLPFDKIPQLWNPKSGILFNSNNSPFVATAPQDDLKPSDFPSWMGIQTNMTNRAQRALRNYVNGKPIGAEDLKRIKYDLAYDPDSEVMADVKRLLALDAHGDGEMLAAQKLLKAWDGHTDIANRAAAIAVLTIAPVITAERKHEGAVSLEKSLRKTIVRLQTHFGRLDPEWGQVLRIVRGKVNLPIDGGPDIYRAAWGEEQPDGTVHSQGGDTLIMFVQWDRAGKVSAQSIHQFGAATSHPESKHYADQTPLFVAMKTKPVWFTDAELAGHIEAQYAPGQGH